MTDLGQFNDLAVFYFDLDLKATKTASILDSTDHLRATGRSLTVSTAAAVLNHEGLTELDLGTDGVLEIVYDEAAAFFVGTGRGLDDDRTPLIGLADIEEYRGSARKVSGFEYDWWMDWIAYPPSADSKSPTLRTVSTS